MNENINDRGKTIRGSSISRWGGLDGRVSIGMYKNVNLLEKSFIAKEAFDHIGF